MPRGEYELPGGLSPQEKTRDALKVLESGINTILTGEAFAGYLHTMARVHHCSAGNFVLISIRCPDATRVAGYHRWKELDCQVKKDEKGIKILVPHKHYGLDSAGYTFPCVS